MFRGALAFAFAAEMAGKYLDLITPHTHLTLTSHAHSPHTHLPLTSHSHSPHTHTHTHLTLTSLADSAVPLLGRPPRGAGPRARPGLRRDCRLATCHLGWLAPRANTTNRRGTYHPPTLIHTHTLTHLHTHAHQPFTLTHPFTLPRTHAPTHPRHRATMAPSTSSPPPWRSSCSIRPTRCPCLPLSHALTRSPPPDPQAPPLASWRLLLFSLSSYCGLCHLPHCRHVPPPALERLCNSATPPSPHLPSPSRSYTCTRWLFQRPRAHPVQWLHKFNIHLCR